MTTGPMAQATGWLGGMPAHNVAKLLDTVKANAGFDELSAMREASPTGAALGNITEREIAYLQATIGNLENTQDATQLQDNLIRVKNAYLDIIHGPGQGPERARPSFETYTPSAYGGQGGAQPGAATGAPTAVNPQTGERLVFQNGQWVPAQ